MEVTEENCFAVGDALLISTTSAHRWKLESSDYYLVKTAWLYIFFVEITSQCDEQTVKTTSTLCLKKTAQLCNGIAQNVMDRFW